jgi:hypothetical protein
MKSLIERQLYRPAVVMPLLILMRLMVTLDFNLLQVTLVVMLKSTQYVFHAVFRPRAATRPDNRPERAKPVRSMQEKTCHC